MLHLTHSKIAATLQNRSVTLKNRIFKDFEFRGKIL